MRRLALALLVLACAGVPAAAQPDAPRVERRWPLAPDGFVKVYNFSGRVVVRGWDRDSIVATARLPKGVQLLGGGDRSAVKIALEAGNGGGAATLVTLELRVPAGAQVWVRGAATEIVADGLIGTVDLGTVSGGVQVRGAPRALTAESMSGALDLQVTTETLRARTGSGALAWRGSATDAQLVTVSGALTVEAGPLGRARLESVTGGVRVTSALRADARVQVETHSGDITLRLPPKSPLRLDADAAEIVAPGVPARTRPADGRITGPAQWDFNLARGALAAPTITVRSFTGRLSLAFAP